MSSYKGVVMMKVYNIFFSPTGGTKKVANELISVWKDDITEIDLIKSKDKIYQADFSNEDIVFISVPSFGGRVPSIITNIFKSVSGNNAKAVLTAVYGNRAYEDTLIELKNILQKSGFLCVAAVAANAEHSIMHQYGKGRPDEQDIAELKEFSLKIKQALVNSTYSKSVYVPGNYPYRSYNGVPMKPTAGKACTACGLCAAECPVEAIPSDFPSQTDKKKCISCMHCISICPIQARSLNALMVNAGALAMKKAFAERKINELFLSDGI